jgi:ABC-type phosphate/phosphonate transport system substrate-binding protein
MSLAAPWLDTLLAGMKLETADRFFGRVKKSNKVAQTVLPVFFESADACLVTRQAFKTMCEMNPQLRRKLLVLAVSPKLFAAFFGIQKDAPDAVKSKIRQALLGYYDTPSGRQILMLFQSNRLVAVDTSLLRGSVDLLAAYDRIKARRTGGSQ